VTQTPQGANRFPLLGDRGITLDRICPQGGFSFYYLQNLNVPRRR